MKHFNILHLLLPSTLLSIVLATPLQLDLPSTTNNITNLHQQPTCFGRTLRQRLYPTTYIDCRHALDSLIATVPNPEISYNFSQNSTLGNYKIPYTQENKTCAIKLYTQDYNDVVPVNMTEIYDVLEMPNTGLFAQCLSMPTPTGGKASFGWSAPGAIGLLFVDVRGIRVGEGDVTTA